MLKHSLKLTVIGLAFFCMSGQMARKEVKEVPSVQCAVNEIELQKEQPKESKEKKSAARRVIDDEGHTTMNRKGAAKKAMELEE